MIRVINTNDKNLNRDYNSEWRNSTNTGMSNKIDDGSLCSTTQSDVDAIANAMDNAEATQEPVAQEQEVKTSEPHNGQVLNPMERDIEIMMQNYIKQNGGIVQEKPTKKNKTLFG